MFELLWFSKKTISNSLSVYVKAYTGRTLTVDLDPKWDIKNVKEVIAPKLGLPPEEVKIIFAGKELDDSTIIEECDLGERSILHAVRSKRSKQGEGTSSTKSLSEILTNLKLSEAIAESDDNTDEESVIQNKVHFYVFCTSPCDSMKTGKLRVRCATCKSGAITVDSDPSSWLDVLKPHRISGHCEDQACPDGAVAWAEFYFKCAEHQSEGEKDQAVPLHLIRANIRSVPCLACTDVSDPVLVFGCGHVTCIDCFRVYCTSRLRERRFVAHESLGYTLPCPANCRDSFIEEPHHFRLLPAQLYNQYQKFGAEEWVLSQGGVLCPQPGCGQGIIVEEDCNKVKCISGCGYVFCKNCRQGYHLGTCESQEESAGAGNPSYAVDPTNVAQAHWNEASKVTIKVMTKPCPKCRTPTERDGGCMHMVCTRCSFEWCWVCQVEWTRDCMGNHWFG